MTPTDRTTHARACLPSDDARRVFDQLLSTFPEASVFWACEEYEDEVELGLVPVELADGFKASTVVIRLSGY